MQFPNDLFPKPDRAERRNAIRAVRSMRNVSVPSTVLHMAVAAPVAIDPDQISTTPPSQADYILHMNDPVYQDIVAARVKMLFEMPFFGNLAVRLKLVDATGWCATAATDGRHLFYNREFIKSLTKPQLLFLIAHEVLHVVYDHFGRRSGRDPKLWNMANDYIVNYTLVEERIGEMPKMGLYDKRYSDEFSSEEVYELLKKNSVTIKMPLDVHLELGNDSEDGDEEGKQPGDGSVSVTVHGKDGPPKLTEADLQKIRAEVKAAVIQSAQQSGAGKVPAGVRRMIEDLINPKLDWRTLLDTHIRSSVKDDYAMHRLSKRSQTLRRMYKTDSRFGGMRAPLLPAQDNVDTVDIACAIDTSGSMTPEMLRDFISEVKGIMQTFREFNLKLWTFDTEVYGYKEFTAQNIDEIDDYDPLGNGGTLFECNWEFMKREGIEPARFVMFTDGYPGGSWGEEGYDVLFIIHGSTTIVAPWGLTCYYEEK
jgi:predicted metal-dependent peptidase